MSTVLVSFIRYRADRAAEASAELIDVLGAQGVWPGLLGRFELVDGSGCVVLHEFIPELIEGVERVRRACGPYVDRVDTLVTTPVGSA